MLGEGYESDLHWSGNGIGAKVQFLVPRPVSHNTEEGMATDPVVRIVFREDPETRVGVEEGIQETTHGGWEEFRNRTHFIPVLASNVLERDVIEVSLDFGFLLGGIEEDAGKACRNYHGCSGAVRPPIYPEMHCPL